MERGEIEKLINEVKIEIQKAGWKEDAVEFSDISIRPANEVEIYNTFSKEIFDREYSFLKNSWEVKQNYVIMPCGKLRRAARKLVRKLRMFLLSDYMARQNAINYTNKQCMRQIQLYINQMQQEKEILETKCGLLEKKIQDLANEVGEKREEK